ncbi:class F sortase, partial [Nocardioides sp.]|uniref:class F sortase n=1 Tax=Nocardioides sp. TaxID=35761 RepID=UPI0035289D22
MRRVIQLAVLAVAVIIAAAGALIALQLPHADSGPAAPAGGVPTADARPDRSARTVRIGTPTRVVIPAIDVDESLTGLGLQADGAMEMPAFGSAGWYDEGPRPGAAGGAVVVAHVRGPAGPDVFWDLHTLQPGDRVVVHGSRARVRFVVVSSETVAKEQLPYDRI